MKFYGNISCRILLVSFYSNPHFSEFYASRLTTTGSVVNEEAYTDMLELDTSSPAVIEMVV